MEWGPCHRGDSAHPLSVQGAASLTQHAPQLRQATQPTRAVCPRPVSSVPALLRCGPPPPRPSPQPRAPLPSTPLPLLLPLPVLTGCCTRLVCCWLCVCWLRRVRAAGGSCGAQCCATFRCSRRCSATAASHRSPLRIAAASVSVAVAASFDSGHCTARRTTSGSHAPLLSNSSRADFAAQRRAAAVGHRQLAERPSHRPPGACDGGRSQDETGQDVTGGTERRLDGCSGSRRTDYEPAMEHRCVVHHADLWSGNTNKRNQTCRPSQHYHCQRVRTA